MWLETDLAGGESLKLVLIPPGTFTMGSPDRERGRGSDEQPHEVELTQGLYVSIHEVTNGQYRRCKSDHASGSGFDGAQQPVVEVSHDDAVSYATWLSSRGGGVFRLPTESEWSTRAARGRRRRSGSVGRSRLRRRTTMGAAVMAVVRRGVPPTDDGRRNVRIERLGPVRHARKRVGVVRRRVRGVPVRTHSRPAGCAVRGRSRAARRVVVPRPWLRPLGAPRRRSPVARRSFIGFRVVLVVPRG